MPVNKGIALPSTLGLNPASAAQYVLFNLPGRPLDQPSQFAAVDQVHAGFGRQLAGRLGKRAVGDDLVLAGSIELDARMHLLDGTWPHGARIVLGLHDYVLLALTQNYVDPVVTA